MGQASAINPPISRRKRVLVVEDEFLVALMLADLLADMGYIVVGPAFELAEARRLAETSPIDAALLDVNLNGVSVDQVADILFERDIPFIFVTGYDRPPAGFYETCRWLNKPYQTSELQRAVEDLVGTGVASDDEKNAAEQSRNSAVHD